MKEKQLTAVTLILLALVLCGVCVLMAAAFSAEQTGVDSPYADAYFDPDTVNTVSITISDENWQDILENPTAEEYHVCNIEINGDTYNGTAIRTKGQMSLSSLARENTDRYSFKIKSDEYVNDQSFKGLNEFCLNCLYQDASSMKDYLTYELMTELGVPTPLYSYAALYINGEYFGLYLMLESVDEDFAARNFGKNYGQLYKPEYLNQGGGGMGGGDRPDGDDMPEGMDFGGGHDHSQAGFNRTAFGGGMQGMGAGNGNDRSMADFNSTAFAELMQNMKPDNGGGQGGFGGGMSSGTTLKYVDDSTSSYSAIFDNAVYTTTSTSASNERVVKAIKSLNQGNPADGVDVEENLKFIAGLGAVVSLDSYIGSMCHNYFLYESDGILQMIPWDYNNAFGGFMSSSTTSSVNFPIDTPVGSGVTLSDRPMVDKLLAVDEYKELYHTYMQWIAENYFNSSFGTHVDAIEAMIEDYIKTDPTAFYTYDEHVAAVSSLKQFGELRGQSILGQLNGTIPSTWDGQNADSSNLIDASGLNMNDLGGMGGGMGGGMDFPGTMPDFGNLTIPQDMQNVGGMTMPENMQMPEDMNMPVSENMARPSDMQDAGGMNMPGSENMARPSDMQNAGGMNMPENIQRPEIQA